MSRCLGCTSAILRFPRRNPLSLLLLLIPLALLIYTTFDPRNPLRFSRPSLSSPASSSPSIPSTSHPSTDAIATNGTRILLVSAFFPLAKSKHSMREYKSWLSLFLSRITTDVYFFTLPEWEPMIREIRGDLPIHINTTFTSSFDIPPLQGRREDYERMHAKDREKHRHSPELYAVWASKPYFLKEGLANSQVKTSLGAGREYKYAFWADAGTFRHKHVWQRWPAPERVDNVWTEGAKESGMKAQDLIFFPLEGMPGSSMSMWNEGMGPIDNSVSEGSFFGGMPSAVAWWYDLYFAYHDHWLEKGIFVGKDQTLINALFLLYPSHIIGVWLSDPVAPVAASLLSSSPAFSSYDIYNPPPKMQLESPLGQCLDYWYYYVFYLGSEAERADMADLWLGTWRWMWPWEWAKQMSVPKEPCRLTRVLPMEWTLKRVFGEGWSSPKTSVTIGKQS